MDWREAMGDDVPKRTWRADEWTAQDWDEWERSRHQCEVRWLCAHRAKNGTDAAWAFLEAVRRRRGQEAFLRLRDDSMRQWKKGNRGRWGDWRE